MQLPGQGSGMAVVEPHMVMHIAVKGLQAAPKQTFMCPLVAQVTVDTTLPPSGMAALPSQQRPSGVTGVGYELLKLPQSFWRTVKLLAPPPRLAELWESPMPPPAKPPLRRSNDGKAPGPGPAAPGWLERRSARSRSPLGSVSRKETSFASASVDVDSLSIVESWSRRSIRRLASTPLLGEVASLGQQADDGASRLQQPPSLHPLLPELLDSPTKTDDYPLPNDSQQQFELPNDSQLQQFQLPSDSQQQLEPPNDSQLQQFEPPKDSQLQQFEKYKPTEDSQLQQHVEQLELPTDSQLQHENLGEDTQDLEAMLQGLRCRYHEDYLDVA